MSNFTEGLSADYARVAKGVRKAVREEDKAVKESPGVYMNSKTALIYTQGGVPKYVLARTAAGLTFHSLVMYSNGEVAAFVEERLSGIKLQKGCFNIIAPDRFDLGEFTELIRISARQDFQPVIDHYARMAKRKKSTAKKK